MARKKTGTEIANWDEELAQQAEIAASAQRSTGGGGGGKFFSIKAGVLSFDDTPMPGNRVAVIVIADILENSYFDGPFVEGEKASPVCFAFGKDEDDMAPHSAVDSNEYFERQSDDCSDCPNNVWGSAAVGKGKACRNVQRLALIPCGEFSEKGSGRNKTLEFDGLIEDPDHYQEVDVAFIKLPVMSVKNYAGYVNQIATDLKRPPFAVFTEMWVEPDPRSQFKVMFEVIDKVPNNLLAVIKARHDKEQAAIDFPYSPPTKVEEPTKTNNKLKGKSGGKR